MLTLAEILALLARDDLTDDERTSLNEALFAAPEGDAAPALRADAFTADELTQLAEALSARADQILDAVAEGATPSQDDLDTLEFVALVSEAVTAEQSAADEADEAARTRAAELADRIRGQAGDDGEPADGDDTDDDAASGGDDAVDDDSADADADAAADVPEPVAASGTPRRVGRVNARRPAATRPRGDSGRTTAPLVASANVPGAQMGARLDTPQALGLAFADTLEAMGSMVMRDGMRIPVAQARIQFPDGAMLSQFDVRANEQLLRRYTGPQAITASGGVDAPPVPRYDLPMFGTDARPVRDMLPRFGSERGGAIIPGALLLDDVDGAATVWTEAMDRAAANDPSVRKPCLRLEAGEDTTVLPYAIVQCLEIGNWNARTWPERVTRFTEKAGQWTARMAESRLLTRIGQLSTQVTVGQLLGTASDTLTALDRAGAQMRSRHRLDPNQQLRWAGPAWLRDEIRADKARQMPGGTTDERLAIADAQIDAWFSARRITPTWFLDGESGQVYGAQPDGALLGWKPNVVSYLYPEGSFIYVDGGGLDLGVVRDSTLNSRNDFQLFAETWEEVAFIGPESLRLSMTLVPDGSTAGTVEPSSNDVGNS